MSYRFGPQFSDQTYTSSSPPGKISDEDDVGSLNFGTVENTRDILATENVASATRLLNYELAHFGYAPLNLDPDNENTSQLIRTLFALLGQQHSNRSYHEEYEDRLHRLAVDHKHAVNSGNRLKEKLEQSLRETESLKIELRQALREIKQEKEKCRLSQEELKQTRSNHVHAKNQFAHDLRRKDVEINRAKDRAQKIIGDKYKATKLGLSALNPPSRRGTPPVSRGETDEDYYAELVRNYVDREEHLVKCYRSLADVLGTLYNSVNGHISRGKNRTFLDPGLLQPEADIEQLRSSIDELVVRLKEARSPKPISTEPESEQLEKQAHQISTLTTELASLESNIEQCRQKISEQDMLLQESKQNEEPIQAARAELANQRMTLERDRAKITQLALLLGHEKAQFARDKDELEKEREEFEYQKSLETPHWLADMDLSRLSLDDFSDGDESDTLAQLIRAGGNMTSPPSIEALKEVGVKKPRSRQDPDSGPRSPQANKTKLPNGKPLPKQATRSNSTLTRPTAAALLKAQATQARLLQRRDTKSKLTPTNEPRNLHSCKKPSCSIRDKPQPFSTSNLNSM